MKKNLIAFFVILCATIYSQTSIQITLKELQVDTNIASVTPYTIAPNGTVHLVTLDSSQTKVTLDITNVGSTTHTYEVKRYDMTLNAPAGYTTVASAYFCFAGSCYMADTYTSTNQLVLRMNQSASDTSIVDTMALYYMLSADLDEASLVGYSLVKYTFYNVNKAAYPDDSVQISLKYNDPAFVGIKQHSKVVSGKMDIYPNPTHDVALVKFNSSNSFNSELTIFNALGEVVQSVPISVTEGNNSLPVNVRSLSSGIYVASLRNGDKTLTKKFIVE